MTREEAIKILQDVRNSRIREAICTLHPELRESEDERIINAIIGILKNSNAIDINVSQEQMIAYLKKQKPQDTVGSVSVEIRSNLQKDEVVRKTLIMLVDAGRISVTGAITNSDILNWLEGQKGQKLAAWRPTEADINLLRKAIDGTKIEPYEWEQLEGIFVGLTKAQEEKK